MDSSDNRQEDAAAEELAASLEEASEEELDALLEDTDDIELNAAATVWLEPGDRVWNLPPQGNSTLTQLTEPENAPAGRAVLVAT